MAKTTPSAAIWAVVSEWPQDHVLDLIGVFHDIADDEDARVEQRRAFREQAGLLAEAHSLWLAADPEGRADRGPPRSRGRHVSAHRFILDKTSAPFWETLSYWAPWQVGDTVEIHWSLGITNGTYAVVQIDYPDTFREIHFQLLTDAKERMKRARVDVVIEDHGPSRPKLMTIYHAWHDLLREIRCLAGKGEDDNTRWHELVQQIQHKLARAEVAKGVAEAKLRGSDERAKIALRAKDEWAEKARALQTVSDAQTRKIETLEERLNNANRGYADMEAALNDAESKMEFSDHFKAESEALMRELHDIAGTDRLRDDCDKAWDAIKSRLAGTFVMRSDAVVHSHAAVTCSGHRSAGCPFCEIAAVRREIARIEEG